MKKLLFVLYFTSLLVYQSSAQTYTRLYSLFQTSCAMSGCHNTQDNAGNLDLVGNGPADVYAKLYNQAPANEFAKNKGYKLVYPGDPYRSFMFRKCNNGLDPSTILSGDEGAPMPMMYQAPKPKEIELLRQWILFGAPQNGSVVDTTLLNNYYENEQGVNSMPEPPPAPNIDEGFQIHIGPFFLPPASEREYFLKYKLENPNAFEIHRLNNLMGEGYSHHFILYRFLNNANNYAEGLRLNNAHANVTNVASFQAVEDLYLPTGTAFGIPINAVFDLNSHYINYLPNKVLACHTYLNVYTQDNGVAEELMQTQLVPQINLNIPPDDNPHTFTYAAYQSNSNLNWYLWRLSSHTHKLGKDFKIWRRKTNGTKGELLYDAQRDGGHPTGNLLGYDYAHPPTRSFIPFYELPIKEGIIFDATYQNPGPNAVGWGFTSEDEMMIAMLQFTNAPVTITGVEDALHFNAMPNLYPNPTKEAFTISWGGTEPITFELYNLQGQKLLSQSLPTGLHSLSTQTFAKGLYAYRFVDKNGHLLQHAKLVVE